MISKETEIQNQISGIKNLKMVKVYHLFGEERPLTGILALYKNDQGNEFINLCETDPCFLELFDKLAGVYFEEVNSYPILADEETKKSLKDGADLAMQEYERMLGDYREESVPMFAPRAFFHEFTLPIVQNLIKEIYSAKDVDLCFDLILSHWFTQGVMTARSRTDSYRFPYYVRQTGEDSFSISVCNVLQAGRHLNAELSFGRGGINANFSAPSMLLTGKLEVLTSGEGVDCMFSLKENGKDVKITSLDCKEMKGREPSKNLRDVMEQGADWKAFELPWDMIIWKVTSPQEKGLIYETKGNNAMISIGSRSRLLGSGKVSYGVASFRLYEREDLTELHLLDELYPRHALYSGKYAGKIFLKNKEREGIKHGSDKE